MIPLDLISLLKENLYDKKENKGKLYAGSHLNGSLRHAMLDVVNAPRIPQDLMDGITLATGNFWHEWITKQIQGIGWPFMAEVRLTDHLPEGWSGRADWVIYNPEIQGFVLGDLKTIKGEGLYWIEKAGAKEDHIWQVSAYWHALYGMGLPMLKGFFVMYWPKNNVASGNTEPSIQECDPLPEEVVYGRMNERWELVKEYIDEVLSRQVDHDSLEKAIINDKLAPPIERLQKLVWNAQQKAFDVKLVPHWSTAYCPYDDKLCDCSNQGTTKIGQYILSGEYSPRSGYESERVDVGPSDSDLARRRAEVAKEASEQNTGES